MNIKVLLILYSVEFMIYVVLVAGFKYGLGKDDLILYEMDELKCDWECYKKKQEEKKAGLIGITLEKFKLFLQLMRLIFHIVMELFLWICPYHLILQTLYFFFLALAILKDGI